MRFPLKFWLPASSFLSFLFLSFLFGAPLANADSFLGTWNAGSAYYTFSSPLPSGTITFGCAGNTPRGAYEPLQHDDLGQISTTTIADQYTFFPTKQITNLQLYGDYPQSALLIGFNDPPACNGAADTLFYNSVPTSTLLSFSAPLASSTVPDFSNWKINVSGVPYGYISISYCRTYAGACIGNQATDTAQYSPFVSANPFPIAKRQPLIFPPLISPVPWQAQACYSAELSGGTSTCSSVINFSAIDLGGGETSSSIPTTVNCSFTSSSIFADPIGVIQNGICNALTFLFLPNSPQQSDLGNRFNAVGGLISKKPPVGYFTIAQSDIAALGTSGAGSSTIISSSTRSSFSALFTPLDEGLAGTIACLALFWVIHRIRNFNFHQ
jgi:hypothetical protein